MTSPVTPEADIPDPAMVRAERRLAVLEELTEIGLRLVRRLDAAAAGEDAGGADPADAFARVSRAIRLTLALEARTDQELRDLRAGVVREREASAERAAAAYKAACAQREDKAANLVAAVIKAQSKDPDDHLGLVEALHERLESDFAYEGCGKRPVREIVEWLCPDLCLDPDWSQWDNEGWKPGYLRDRPVWDPYGRPSRLPIDQDDGDEPAPAATPKAARQLE